MGTAGAQVSVHQNTTPIEGGGEETGWWGGIEEWRGGKVATGVEVSPKWNRRERLTAAQNGSSLMIGTRSREGNP